ncbi:hypothetical protein KP509_34G070300 [Ceratopteris richardii]|uniref:Uncharacterized protein n=1 Tax=Ceratopteris richardii TaxID=49495 RepID=A0A8T2QKU2_CERRI|nr:hypothetical protein KP509_34G070300 [Ceratopteris richardii]
MQESMRTLIRRRVPHMLAAALLLIFISASFIVFVFIHSANRSPANESFSFKRTELYEIMASDLSKHGAKFLDGGFTSQALSLSDIFRLKDGYVEPILKPANPAVRAIVLYLDPEYSHPISNIVKKIVAPVLPKAVWYQDSNMFHFSMFHASHHLEPVVAATSEVNLEAQRVETVAGKCCALSIVLERVILTSTGVLLGCWQVVNGTDPAIIRRELRKSLPHAPVKQLYNEVMLHTSFARLLGSPVKTKSEKRVQSLHEAFERLVSQLNSELRGFKAVVKEMWFVEEFDVLALALKGHLRERRFGLQCEEGNS